MNKSIHSLQNFQNLKIEKRAFIRGQFILPLTNERIPKICPANGKQIPALYAYHEEDLTLAVTAALEAQKAWEKESIDTRKNIVLKWAALLEGALEELAYLDTLETGRAYANFYNDSIPKAIDAMRWFAESVDKGYERFVRPSPQSMAYISRQALGVVGVITPWNDPLVVSMWKLIPALLMGNTVIMKPAEQSSYSILKAAQFAQKAGIPDGVLNILTGYGEVIGKAIALHPEIRGVFFTGSSEVGKKIMQYAGQSNMKKVGLECGGKSAFLVTPNCKDLNQAAQTLAQNIFYNQGQICSAPSRLIIHHEIKAQFLRHLLAICEKYQPGDPFDTQTYVGSVVSEAQFNQVQNYIQDGLKSGAVKLTPDLNAPPLQGGFYIAPTIFEQVKTDSKIAQEEIFGPVLSVIEYTDLDEAIALANNTPYGLAAAIWSNDLDEALSCAQRLEAGLVHVNSYGDDNNAIPFGGIKLSGIGKDKSSLAFDEYSELKSTWINLKG